MNVYAPSKQHKKSAFFKLLHNELELANVTENDKIISAGGWNSVFDEEIDKSGGRNIHSNVVDEMHKIIYD